ncbi:MAG TPA: hypothetical protein VFB96_15330 [Pirellulaceae bacterium]|nr:hypothetical protein [Pirellulaceae bacterium]
MPPQESPATPPETELSTAAIVPARADSDLHDNFRRAGQHPREATADPLTTEFPSAAAKQATGEPPPAPPAPRRLKYLPAFRYVFDNPDWFVSVVLLSVCGFIPVLGHVAQWGFYYHIVEALHRRPDAPYPKFDFRRFGDYGMRGVWPYVLMMMVGMILYLVLYLPLQLSLQFGLIFLLNNRQVALIVLGIVVPILMVGMLTVALGTAVLTAPMLLRAGLTQDIRLIFRFDWFKGYLRRVWVEETLASLFLMAAFALTPLGCLVFGFGFIAAQVIVWIAASHLQWQIYEIYLERGGEPIPLHPLPAEEPPVKVEMPRQ